MQLKVGQCVAVVGSTTRRPDVGGHPVPSRPFLPKIRGDSRLLWVGGGGAFMGALNIQTLMESVTHRPVGGCALLPQDTGRSPSPDPDKPREAGQPSAAASRQPLSRVPAQGTVCPAHPYCVCRPLEASPSIRPRKCRPPWPIAGPRVFDPSSCLGLARRRMKVASLARAVALCLVRPHRRLSAIQMGYYLSHSICY